MLTKQQFNITMMSMKRGIEIINRRILLLLVFVCTSCTFAKIVWHGFANIDDFEIFPARYLRAGGDVFRFNDRRSESNFPTTVSIAQYHNEPLDRVLAYNDTVAFIVIKNSDLLYERYFQGFDRSTQSISFSMSKSFLSILIGCAIDDGIIKSVDQPITDFVPELKENGFDRVKIEHLLQMTSGLDYEDGNNPFGMHPRFYYGDNLEQMMLDFELAQEPGQEFTYKSGENELLGLVLSRALRDRTITDYTQQKLWTPLGMEFDGAWNLDREGGLEKTFCCLSGRAIDFVKIGLMFLNGGRFNGKTIVSEEWVKRSTMIDTSQGSSWKYQYQWWMVSKNSRDFMASGHKGQILYVMPSRSMVFVRLGQSRGGFTTGEWQELFREIAENLRDNGGKNL